MPLFPETDILELAYAMDVTDGSEGFKVLNIKWRLSLSDPPPPSKACDAARLLAKVKVGVLCPRSAARVIVGQVHSITTCRSLTDTEVTACD